jgi:diguanylate cyclase (GGDEF)-like protein/PAS domain S-box-containing protein
MTPFSGTLASFLNSSSRWADFLENVVRTCPEGIIANDPEGNIFLYNASAQRIFGYAAEEVFGKLRANRLYPPGGAREVKEYLYSEEFGGRGHLVDFETEVVRKDGKRVPIRLCCALLSEGNREIGTIGFFTDISVRKALLERFLESEERFRGIFESARDAMVSVGEQGQILMANQSAQEMLGYLEGELPGMEAIRLFPARLADFWRELVLYASRMEPGHERRNIEMSVATKRSVEVPVQVTLAEKTVRGQRILTAIFRDISDRKALEEELRLQSITDPLTGLYNRRHFLSLAEVERERAQRHRTPFSILLIDVDRFKQYNDAHGHGEGDVVLKALGDAIRGNFRTIDTGFRYGGEEFLVLLPDTASEGAVVSAERLRARFSGIPFRPRPDGGIRTVTLSIGAAEYRRERSVGDLVRAADQAMYSAKNAGRNRTVLYDRLVPEAPRGS